MAEEGECEMSPAPEEVTRWRALAEKYAKVHPILDPDEVLAIIWSESYGNPNAVNLSDPSYGLMGVSLTIGVAFAGVKLPSELYDPDTNVKAGSGFLAHLKIAHAAAFPLTDKECAWPAAYNEGEPNLEKQRPDPAYVAAFVSHWKELKA